MAVDEAMLSAVLGGTGPTLRLYGWSGPWITLGYTQSPERALDASVLARVGAGLVRRPTGGKALLHDRDLTYSIALGPDHPWSQLSVADSYVRLCAPLVDALCALGMKASLSREVGGGPLCESRPAPVLDRESCRADLPCAAQVHVETVLIGGRKLIGSAQVRRHGAVLQHGSIPLARSPDSLVRCLARPGRGDDDFVAWYRSRTTTLEDEGHAISRETVEAAVMRSFSGALARATRD